MSNPAYPVRNRNYFNPLMPTVALRVQL